MAKKRVNARGRVWVAAIFLGFVLVAASVIQRRVVGIAQALELKQLEQELQAAISEKGRLQGDIEAAQSLARIGPVAEKLGMRPAQETQVINIPKQSR